MTRRISFPVRIAAVFGSLAGALALLPQTRPDTPVYLDSKRPIEERVDDLMSRMTLKEKVGQLNLPCVYVHELGRDIPSKLEACRRFTAGTYTNEIGPGCGFFTLANEILHKDARQQAEYFNELQKIALTQTRLKIPVLEDEEGTHGGMFPGATVFPEGLAIGSSFDLDLVSSIYAAAAAEARAVGIHMLSTLVMEVDRDPRMGRNEEAYTEDPYLYSRIGETIVRATQGSDISAPDKVIAVLTDFPTQSEPSSGLERGAVEVSERSLRENYMPPWVGAITKAGGLGVMAGYPEVEDVPAHASEKWMNDVLRQELGFRGVVVSEGGGFGTLIYEDIVKTQKEAGALALKAGVDVNITYEPAYMGPLIENVEEGRVPMALVDRALRRVLELKFRLGLFEHPYVDVEHAVRTVHSQAHQDLALRAGREGIVLLKNEKNTLPLRKDLKSIAVIGPDAENLMNLLGDYSPKKITQHVVSILEGIKGAAGPQAKVVWAKGCGVLGEDKSGFPEAVRAAKSADVAVVVVGENQGQNDIDERKDPPTDGEGHDVASLDLTGVQEDLVKAVYETGTPTVVVLVNGRPLSTRWTAANVTAIVEAWRPGERGGQAVADVLFGNYNPTGRLAITIPRHSGQLPAYYNYKPSKAYWMNEEKRGYADMPATPLYPFGHGLSYTNYEYSNLRIEPSEIRPGGTARVSVDVKNTGERAGAETVQLYVHETVAPVSLPVKQLRGFEQVSLNPGETKTVTLPLGPEDLQLLDPDMHWRVVPGDFEVMVGKSSEDLPLRGILKVIP
ncbi:MAG TPA: glycoside hydrolase family 3 C-terminal domain-containing protein [Bryobacteraceae bacterium]|nr:glycoside hydrolase family 3 C-terminal domain-containing protein [Bryobacteraceae bacterium]